MAGKRRGRPRISDEATERFDVRLPQSVVDGLCRQALALGIPLAEHARAALTRQSRERILSVKNRQPAESSAP